MQVRELKIQRKNPGSALRVGQCSCRVTLNPKTEGGKKGLGFNLVSFQKPFQNFGFLSLSPTALGQSPEILEVSRELRQNQDRKSQNQSQSFIVTEHLLYLLTFHSQMVSGTLVVVNQLKYR
jgi:hypothetical protein